MNASPAPTSPASSTATATAGSPASPAASAMPASSIAPAPSATPASSASLTAAATSTQGSPVASSVERFLDELASAAPTPGGGSAAAVMGAMGAALVSMVCNLTIGKKGHEHTEAELRPLLVRSEALRQRLAGNVNHDILAFGTVMAAYRLPKTDEAQKALRAATIQQALRGATEAPLDCARACAEVIDCCEPAARLGNANVVSDAGVAVLAALAALRSAALNVDINVPQLQDRPFAEAAAAEVAKTVAEACRRAEEIHALVKSRLG